MGDRANVYIHHGDNPGIYLYSHWDGTELPSVVKRSMDTERAKRNYNDAEYLAHVIFEDIFDEDPGNDKGYALSLYPLDGENRIVDIDTNVGYGEPSKVTLKGYPYTWANIPKNPYNICGGCGRPLPD